MNLTERFEEKRRQLATIEQREAFLRQQLEEAIAARLKLIGQMEMLQELFQAEQVEPVIEGVTNGRDHRSEH